MVLGTIQERVRQHLAETVTSMPIVQCSNELMEQAEALVRSVFVWMSPIERFSFIAIKYPKSVAGRVLMDLAGIKDMIEFDVYVDGADLVLGTTGLYRYKNDANEAVWVAWFCVDPKARGRGIGQALIDHTVSRARDAGFNRIRLYTSTDPNEEAAQRLYEKNGFKEILRKKGMFTTTIFREKTLNDAEQPIAADG